MFAAAIILASIYLPGHFLGGRLSWKGDALAELAMLRIFAALAIAAPVLTALALAGLFTIPAIVGVFVCLSVGAFVLGRGAAMARASRWETTRRVVSTRWAFVFGRGVARASRWDVGAVALVVGGFALYAARPAEYVVNSRDPGVYALLADKLARTGKLLHRDPLVEAVSSFHPFLDGRKYPGFHIMDGAAISPQFFPGPFAFLGLGNLVGGVWGSLFVVPVMGALAVGAAFMLGREVFGKWAGFLGAALLVVGYTQIWWARHPSSEIMTQLFILAGLWLAVRFAKRTDAATGVLAGLLLGGAMLLRVDAFLAALALPILFAYDSLTRREARKWLYPGVPLALFAAASLVYLNTVGGRYLHIIYSEHDLEGVLAWWPHMLGAAAILAVALAYIRRRWGRSLGDYLEVRGGGVALVGAMCVVALALWAYIVLPVPWESLTPDLRDFDAYRSQVAVRMVWFITPAVAILALIGVVLAARRPDAPRTILLGAILAFGVLYVANPNVAPDLPWATRRFVPAVFPGMCLLAGFTISEAAKYIGRAWSRPVGAAVAGAMFAASFAWTAHFAAPIIPFRELDGAVAAFEKVEAKIPAAEVVYMEMPDGYDMTASTFDYMHGRPVIPYDRIRFIREKEDLEKAGLLDDAVYITTDGKDPPYISGLEFDEVAREKVALPYLSPVEGHENGMGMDVADLRKDYRIYRVGS